MYHTYTEQEWELLPEFEVLFQSDAETLYPETEFELFQEAGMINWKNPEYIKWVQKALNKVLKLGAPLPVNGVLTSRTSWAIRYFQGRQSLKVDGIAGPKTELKLIMAGAECCPPR
jgi:peptidoglycan hydrolase-like protein with peptidoglycan-binding domain